MNDGKFDANIHILFESQLKEDVVCPYRSEKVDFLVEKGKKLEYELFALPQDVGMFRDKMIILLNDNPDPYIFNVQCEGVTPEISVSTRSIDFGNLLLGQSITKSIKVENTSKIPVKVFLTNVDTEKKQFKISITEFVIKQFEEQIIDITFCSEDQSKFESIFNIEYTDVEECGTKKDPLPITLTAEAFKVMWDIK